MRERGEGEGGGNVLAPLQMWRWMWVRVGMVGVLGVHDALRQRRDNRQTWRRRAARNQTECGRTPGLAAGPERRAVGGRGGRRAGDDAGGRREARAYGGVSAQRRRQLPHLYDGSLAEGFDRGGVHGFARLRQLGPQHVRRGS